MPRKAPFIVLTAAALLSPAVSSSNTLDSLVDHALAFAGPQLERTVARIKNDSTVHPQEADSIHGKWLLSGNLAGRTRWSSGYWSACLWYMYNITGEKKWADHARRWTGDAVSSYKNPRTLPNKGVDMAVIIDYSCGIGYKTLQDSAYAAALTGCADQYIASFWLDNFKFFNCWGAKPRTTTKYTLLIDFMLHMELMFETAILTGDTSYYNKAIHHIEKTMKSNIRADGSCRQFTGFTSAGKYTGANSQVTRHYQGYASKVESTWSRGQAWAIIACPMIYNYTKDEQYLALGKRCADYYLDNLPEDGMPWVDFDVPLTDKACVKDASAGSIACSGLFDLYRHTREEKYRVAAEKLLALLCSADYLSEGTSYETILRKANHKYPKTTQGLIYADSFLLESIMRYKGIFLELNGPVAVSNSRYAPVVRTVPARHDPRLIDLRGRAIGSAGTQGAGSLLFRNGSPVMVIDGHVPASR